ncbi:MAG TPA: T9SS type A sorting domain-containing protein, partial [Candidatus Kapabacteria bacterium]|nr:T9SS type A sorting domain-containing protein [Candidatus Kapabacteria bacterium]
MKNLAIFLVLVFAAIPTATAQSIMIGPLPGTAFCTGDKVVVPFTASGTYTSKNSFIVQVSDKDGSFDKFFYNVGEVRTPNSGEVTITIPQLEASPNYRMRVISSDPYVVSTNISPGTGLGPQPDMSVGLSDYDLKFGMIGEPMTFNSSGMNTAVTWDFGPTATPRISTAKNPTVTFNTPGFKVISFTASSFGGCSRTQIWSEKAVYVGTCNPIIPKTAVVDSVENFSGHGYQDIWVVPGGWFEGYENGIVVYAEPGSTISRLRSGSVYYLKAGTSVLNIYDGNAIYEDGVGFQNFDRLDNAFRCTNLEFDYSDAPPYKINKSAVSRVKGRTVQVYPNPTTDRVTIEHAENHIREISIRNTLGAEQFFVKPEGRGKTTVDVSRLVAGIYFLDL